MNQIVNLLSGFQKQFPPTNNQLKTSTNPMTHATIQAGQIITESVQRRAPGNKGKQVATESQGKAGICYNCHGEGHVARQCREKKQAKYSQWFKDKALLMEAKEKGAVLDAEAKAFLADVECTVPYVEPLAITTTTAFEVSHEDAYDSDVDDAPHVAATFMANLMQTGPSTDKAPPIRTQHFQRAQLVGNIKANEEHSFANESLKAELERYKTQQLSQHVESNKYLKTKSEKLKANKNALEESYIEELVCLRNTNKVATELLQLYGQHVQIVLMLTKRPTFATKYLHKTVLSHRNPRYLKSAQLSRLTLHIGDVIVDPLHTPFKVHDSEDTLVQAEVSRTKISKRMKDPRCKVSSKHVNYAKLNSFYDTFVPQKELSIEQVYRLPVNEVASHNSNQSKPVTNFVHTRPAKSQLQGKDESIKKLKAQISNMKEVSANPNLSTLEVYALETENTQLKEELIAIRIKHDSLRDENVSIKKRYQDLSMTKASNSNVSSGAVVPEKPKVLAPGLYAMTPMYVSPQRRNNRDVNAPLPRKETVPLVTKINVFVNLKSVTEASKSKSKCETKTYMNLPARSEKSVSVFKTCNDYLVFGNHDKCGVKPLKSMNAKNPKVKNKAHVKQVWKPNGKVFASVGSKWKPTGRIFTLGDTCPLTRITKPEAVPLGKSRSITTSAPTSCSWDMTGDRSKLINFVEKFIGQFCDAGLEVAFRKHTCYIRNEDKVDLLKGSRSTNLYSISLKDVMEASPVFLLLKASSAKSWL
uniref:CCHC-type domain-containing protein n=1 Tax=Tanacetum cinerariifolium TaxID=118510 RepID=A0A699HCZ1_TANCI|nr:hypothetical protein [Tanacetum cinerariifolium]